MKNRIKNIFFPRKNEEIKSKISIKKTIRNPILLDYLKDDDEVVLVDVGAHNGAFTDMIINYCGVKKGLLVEPLSENVDFLKEKFDKEKFDIYQNAVSDEDNQNVKFFVNGFTETSSLLKIRENCEELSNVNVQQKEEIEIVTKKLDTIVAQSKFENIDLLKIDVQGAEHLVLKGAKETLKKTKKIWVEVSFKPLYEGSSVFKDIYDILSKAGFMLIEISPGHRSPRRELLQADVLFINKNYS